MCGTEQAASVIKPSPAIGSVTRDHNSNGTNHSSDYVINLDHGDPTMYEPYWLKMSDKCTVVIPGFQSLSYFANTKNLCWFMDPELEKAIKRLHHVVGNAVVEDHHIVVGTGSTQLIQAALYAITTRDGPNSPEPISVVSAVPYYSAYAEITEYLRSRLYKWGGDANTYDHKELGAYIEIVTSPNNPDGKLREAIVKQGGGEGKLVHDLAYYWPQYTPITKAADYDIMLFTVSKCTGHAGSRIGWAVIKDEEVARKMTKFMEVNTIGVSKESQLRAAKILGAISDSCQHFGSNDSNNFFGFGQRLMAERWDKLRNVIGQTEFFTLPKYPQEYCLFTGNFTDSHPAFAWMKSNKSIEDCQKLLKEQKILSRGGRHFGTDPKFVRISMVGKEEDFNLFLERLLAIQGTSNGNQI